jgi:DNA repair exonuclease SbcCD nuclease subunit
MPEVIAILCSDIHLCSKTPIARAEEPDWFAAMKRPFDELVRLRIKHGYVPILCAGDVFDKWNSTPELINFAIDIFPTDFYAIPGQHDLPYHRYEDIKKSAYYTLHRAEAILDISRIQFEFEGGGRRIAVNPFYWGYDPCPLEGREDYPDDDSLYIALIHSYIWQDGSGYPGAPEEKKIGTFLKKIQGYDVAVVGDNHKGFLNFIRRPIVFNCGTLIRRKSDEIDYKPQVGLLYSDGTVKPHYLDISQDKISASPEVVVREKLETDVSKFLEELKSLGADSLDYTAAVYKFMEEKDIESDVRKEVLTALEA